jgi:glycerol-3-phosphate acyltransferase PlsY
VRPDARGPARGLGWIAAGAAAGCLPSARLVTRALTGADITRLGDGKPGTSNVRKSLGLFPSLVVFALDCGKGYAVGRLARRAGAGEHVVGAASVAAIVTHVTVVGGQGAATGVGAQFAMDAPLMAAGWVPIGIGTVVHHHAEAVILTGLAFGPARWLWRREPAAVWSLALAGVLIFARLRGPRGAAPLTRRNALSRFWFDRDPGQSPAVADDGDGGDDADVSAGDQGDGTACRPGACACG